MTQPAAEWRVALLIETSARLWPPAPAGNRRLRQPTWTVVVLRQARRFRTGLAGDEAMGRHRHHRPHHDSTAREGDCRDRTADHCPRPARTRRTGRQGRLPWFQRIGHRLVPGRSHGGRASPRKRLPALRVCWHTRACLVRPPRKEFLRGDCRSRFRHARLSLFAAKTHAALGHGAEIACRLAPRPSQAGRTDGLQRRPRPRSPGSLPRRPLAGPRRDLRASASTTIRCSAISPARRFPASPSMPSAAAFRPPRSWPR